MSKVLMLSMAISFGASIAPADKMLNSIRMLHDAVRNGDIGSVSQLLDAKVDVNLRNPKTRQTALHIAAQMGNTEIIPLLICSRACVGSMDSLAKKPIQYAIENCNYECIELLSPTGSSAGEISWWLYLLDIQIKAINKVTDETQYQMDFLKKAQLFFLKMKDSVKNHSESEDVQSSSSSDCSD